MASTFSRILTRARGLILTVTCAAVVVLAAIAVPTAALG
jgi:hypothetical protein